MFYNHVKIQRGEKMSSLFLAGNGFDLAHGIPTKYSDLREFVLQLFPDALHNKDLIVNLDDFKELCVGEFAAEILLHTMDLSAGKEWNDFENALSKINFNAKFPMPNHKENETEQEDRELMEKYLLYIDKLSSGFIQCTKMWQDFIQAWLKNVEQQIEYGDFQVHPCLQELFMQDDMQFFTFNYTKTLQKMYKVKKSYTSITELDNILFLGMEKKILCVLMVRISIPINT